MAYKKKYTKRCPKQTVYGSATFLAQKAIKGVAALKGIINSELKKVDVTATTTPTTTGTVIHLTGTAQGDTIGTRNGNSVLLKYISFKGLLSWNASANSSFLTMYIVKDIQQVGDTTPAVTDFLDTSYGSLGVLNTAYPGRFKILLKKKYVQDAKKPISVDLFIKTDYHLKYNGTAASDIQKNGTYLVLISNEATNTPSIQWMARAAYYDN